MIVQVNVVLNRTVVVDSDLRFDSLCGSHLQSQRVTLILKMTTAPAVETSVTVNKKQSYSGLHSPGRSYSSY